MAEDPRSWTEVEKTISDTLVEIHKENLEDAKNGDFRCGLSTPMRIANALRAKGLINDVSSNG